MATRATPVFLDHIIILVPHADVVTPPEWLTRHFNVIPGGYHANKQTHNNLISFRDGSYIELIAFVDDADSNRVGHRWGRKKNGIIDFAFMSPSTGVTHYEALKSRLEALGDWSITYEPPIAGGRTRPDGIELKWETTFPVKLSRGKADEGKEVETPFFCHDVGPNSRELRVPPEKADITHPCGAYGIDELNIYVPAARVAELTLVYSAILDDKNFKWSGGEEGSLPLEKVHSVEDAKKSILRIQTPKEEWQKKTVAERGFLIADLKIGGTDGVGSDVLSRLEQSF